MPTAKIEITITKFRDIAATPDIPRWTEIDPPRLTDNAGGKVSIDPTTPMVVSVRGRASVNLEFTILPLGVYAPAGIAFVQTAGTGDPLGKKNFDLGQLTESTITINDKFSPPQPPGTKTRWKYYLLVQETASRALGIIDPEIENEN